MKNNHRSIQFLIIAFSLISLNVLFVHAATYYVDATGGNDTNSGLSPQNAWKSVIRVNNSNFNPGDMILFKMGEKWRNQLIPQSGSESKPIIYSTYGTGKKPMLLGSIAKNDVSHWIKEEGNIWIAQIIEEIDVGNIIFNDESACGVKTWTEANLRNQGDFWYDADNSFLKIYSQSNPADNYSNIECALRKHIIQILDKNHIIIENLDLRYGGAHGIWVNNSHHIIIRNCDISFIGGGNLYVDDRKIRFGNGIEFWENAHDCIVESCRIWEIYDAALTNQGLNTNMQYNIYYRFNIIWNCEYSFEYWNRPSDSLTDNIFFDNNTCLTAGYGWSHDQRPDPSGRHFCSFTNEAKTSNIYIRNNIFYNTKEAYINFSSTWTGNENLVIDYNCYFSDNQIYIFKYKNTEYDFYQYRDAMIKDINSLIANPELKNLQNDNVFILKFNSPCIDAGMNVGYNSDFLGNKIPYGEGIDIGACESYYLKKPINLRILD